MASYYDQEPEDRNSYQKTVAMCVAAASLVVLLFLVILYVNSDKGTTSSRPVSDTAAEETEEKEDDILKESHNITSDELEFWNDAPKDKPAQKEEEGELTPYKDPQEDDKDMATDSSSTENNGSEDEKKKDGVNDTEESLNKEATGDKEYDKDNYYAIEDDNGKKTYYEIIKDMPRNDYNLENNLINENGLLTYKDSKRESVKGVDLSKYNGTVDFAKLKEAGVGFAMLRLASRGYGSGKISLDEKFVEYAQNAQVAGIQIGAFFYSQAVNENEAVEEANYIVGAISGFNVKYPVAIDIERVSGDEARTDKLTNKERTSIVKMFCDTVKGYGYKPIIYASSEMLVGGLDLKELQDYDVWLADEKIPTEYPYRFGMWQYNTKGHIDGITGDIDLDISFIDYERK
jgi:GH25 family lysozyme M1 (1,4-beta-N-acetylmuramidase)